jgi:hypothetical protein
MGQQLVRTAGAFAWMLFAAASVHGQDISLATNASGITIAGSKPSWSTGFGTVNGLGLGTPGANITVMTTTGGVLYTSPYNIVITGASSGNRAVVRAYVSTNFSHPSILKIYSCVSSCTSAAGYSAVSTSSSTPTDIIGDPGLNTNQTVTRSLAVFVSNANGASAFTGTDSATLTVLVYRGNNNSLQHTYTLALNNPTQTVQTALRFTLGTAPGGRTIAPASDFSLGFGNVNGLGIAPGTGLTAAVDTGGGLYSTAYLLQPVFAGFSSTTGTIKAYVSTDFIHPSQLELRDSSTGATYSAISKSAGAQTTLTSSAASGAALTRYIGLYVSGVNGATVFTGGDNASVTFTLVVP